MRVVLFGATLIRQSCLGWLIIGSDFSINTQLSRTDEYFYLKNAHTNYATSAVYHMVTILPRLELVQAGILNQKEFSLLICIMTYLHYFNLQAKFKMSLTFFRKEISHQLIYDPFKFINDDIEGQKHL